MRACSQPNCERIANRRRPLPPAIPLVKRATLLRKIFHATKAKGQILPDKFPPERQRAALIPFAKALGSRDSALRRDECGDLRIAGTHGHVYAVPNGFQFFVMGWTARGWKAAKDVLPGVVCNDGDDEGGFILCRPRPKPSRSEVGRRRQKARSERTDARASPLSRLRSRRLTNAPAINGSSRRQDGQVRPPRWDRYPQRGRAGNHPPLFSQGSVLNHAIRIKSTPAPAPSRSLDRPRRSRTPRANSGRRLYQLRHPDRRLRRSHSHASDDRLDPPPSPEGAALGDRAPVSPP